MARDPLPRSRQQCEGEAAIEARSPRRSSGPAAVRAVTLAGRARSRSPVVRQRSPPIGLSPQRTARGAALTPAESRAVRLEAEIQCARMQLAEELARSSDAEQAIQEQVQTMIKGTDLEKEILTNELEDIKTNAPQVTRITPLSSERVSDNEPTSSVQEALPDGIKQAAGAFHISFYKHADIVSGQPEFVPDWSE
ncbi:unnamed protein product [Prorocentrum cordatum]|uniref:Uncharacterized protein n=1 Tax=Prorocentrum cordatum TaxID=2364126 RepID=A0ABN9SJY9_9DINO|nr:unnamed protein product [Polarella glacialis]